ncbi:hypothetical protein L1889_07060 [Paenalcaligenes niemegkensis]|uniref:hypothetical protein n=1 Tax=Paenalcaligenes niemegkensis TaxID=2895469 RepID=UPI001EE806AA|nr:hypothetical protein [Paenalcaligenes niemegkensis]MCQ9616498.1 hypothetical protein [Paenalcaligenes niemegkensis]
MRLHDAAISGNQYAVADGIESLSDTHSVYRQFETLAKGQAPRPLDALSGELYASTLGLRAQVRLPMDSGDSRLAVIDN